MKFLKNHWTLFLTLVFAGSILFASSVAHALQNDRFSEYRDLLGGNDGGDLQLDFGGLNAGDNSSESTTDATVQAAAAFRPPQGDMPGVLSISLDIPGDWYIYSITQPDGGPFKTSFHLPDESIRVAGTIETQPKPEVKGDKELWGNILIETHKKSVTWRIPFQWATPEAQLPEIAGSVEFQMCNEMTCLPPKKVDFVAKLDETLPPPTPETSPAAASGENQSAPKLGTSAPGVQPPAEEFSSLWVCILFAYLGGLILNLMPCVLPVIAPKIYSFVHQSGESRSRVFFLNLAYVFGLLTVFWILAALSKLGNLTRFLAEALPPDLGAKVPVWENMAWGAQFQYPAFCIFMICLVFVMGLSFLSVWEIPIPGLVAGGSLGKMQRKEGLLGAYCMGILTTILATPCVGPFLGPVFGFLMTQAVWMSFLIFSVIGLGLATPYLVVGMFPALVRFLPKPGDWMETFKEIMGFFFLAAVVLLFYVLIGISPDYVVPTLSLLVALWFACWLIGKTTLSGASSERVIIAWCAGIIFASIVGVGMFHFWFGESTIDEKNRIAWVDFSIEKIDEYRAQNKPVFIDFTANWCMTCKWNSLNAIETEDVGEAIRRNGIVPVLADWTNPNPEIGEYLERFNRKSIPVVIIWMPGEDTPLILDGFLTQAALLEALEGRTPETPSSATPQSAQP
ncbi:MAG: thioredoxin family protein [Planctomycetia bacterium]|nr:thioredoxin family protein [Planctomycetia bacterium]